MRVRAERDGKVHLARVIFTWGSGEGRRAHDVIFPHPRPPVPDAVYRLHPWRRRLLDSGSELRSTSSIPGVVPEGEGIPLSTGMLLHELVREMGLAVKLLHIIQLFQHLNQLPHLL